MWTEKNPPARLPKRSVEIIDKEIPKWRETPRFRLSDLQIWHIHEQKKRAIWKCGDCVSYAKLCDEHARYRGCIHCKKLHRIDVWCTRDTIGVSDIVKTPEMMKKYTEEWER